jgi:non-ribosomal peptide synthetase component E (peptide arylation enzyme)
VTKDYIHNEKPNKEAFASNGFLEMGDQGKKDQDSYVINTGRIKELINRGGEKTSPIELALRYIYVYGMEWLIK